MTGCCATVDKKLFVFMVDALQSGLAEVPSVEYIPKVFMEFTHLLVIAVGSEVDEG